MRRMVTCIFPETRRGTKLGNPHSWRFRLDRASMTPELDNLRLTLITLERRADPLRSLRMVNALYDFWSCAGLPTRRPGGCT